MHARLAAVAAHNGGPFTRAEALRAGESAASIRGNLRRGDWATLRRGVYVDADVLRDASRDTGHRHALEVAAAVLALATDDAVGSHFSAARIHGLGTLGDPAPGVTLTRHGGYDRRSPDLNIHVARLPGGQREDRFGIPVTTPARTGIDLARTLPFREAVVLADSVLRDTPARLADLRDVLASCAGWPGASRAADVVSFVDPFAESVFESVNRVVFAEQRLPPPQTQVVVGDERGAIGRVDFYWPRYRTVGEADGLSKYATPAVLAAEKTRQERLIEAGFEVVRFTWCQVIRTPVETARRIRAAFARGMAR